MRIRTRLTDMLGIEVPIIAAPMFLVSYEEYVIAHSEAGTLGAFPLPNYRTPQALESAPAQPPRDPRSRRLQSPRWV